MAPGQFHHLRKEQVGDLVLEQPILVLAVAGGVEGGLIQGQIHKPAEQHIGLQARLQLADCRSEDNTPASHFLSIGAMSAFQQTPGDDDLGRWPGLGPHLADAQAQQLGKPRLGHPAVAYRTDGASVIRSSRRASRRSGTET